MFHAAAVVAVNRPFGALDGLVQVPPSGRADYLAAAPPARLHAVLLLVSVQVFGSEFLLAAHPTLHEALRTLVPEMDAEFHSMHSLLALVASQVSEVAMAVQNS